MAQPDAVFQKCYGWLYNAVSQVVDAVQDGNSAAPACEHAKKRAKLFSCKRPHPDFPHASAADQMVRQIRFETSLSIRTIATKDEI